MGRFLARRFFVGMGGRAGWWEQCPFQDVGAPESGWRPLLSTPAEPKIRKKRRGGGKKGGESGKGGEEGRAIRKEGGRGRRGAGGRGRGRRGGGSHHPPPATTFVGCLGRWAPDFFREEGKDLAGLQAEGRFFSERYWRLMRRAAVKKRRTERAKGALIPV